MKVVRWPHNTVVRCHLHNESSSWNNNHWIKGQCNVWSALDRWECAWLRKRISVQLWRQLMTAVISSDRVVIRGVVRPVYKKFYSLNVGWMKWIWERTIWVKPISGRQAQIESEGVKNISVVYRMYYGFVVSRFTCLACPDVTAKKANGLQTSLHLKYRWVNAVFFTSTLIKVWVYGPFPQKTTQR